MKKILILLISLLFVSCIKETLSETPATRRIINKTKYQVSIEVFGDDERLEYELAPFDTLDIEGSCFSGMETYCFLGWGTLAYANIYFNNEKVQRFKDLPPDCENKAINADPIGGCYGYILSEESEIKIYTYEITQEDYDNAEFL